jgi:hypothetical protein
LRHVLKILTVFLLLNSGIFSQEFVDFGFTAGSGIISSNSPYFAGYTSSVSAGWGTMYDYITPRATFYYAGDFNSLLPASRRSYYPFIRAFAFKGIYAINVTGDLYYEQSLGLFAANDRIFSSSNSWGGGFIVGVLGGVDLRGDSYSGVRIGVGGEYGLTVYNNYVRYLGLFLQLQYIISYNF